MCGVWLWLRCAELLIFGGGSGAIAGGGGGTTVNVTEADWK